MKLNDGVFRPKTPNSASSQETLISLFITYVSLILFITYYLLKIADKAGK